MLKEKKLITTASITLILLISNTIFQYIGATINLFFPCNQNPNNSFPCHLTYDLYATIFFILVILIIGILFLYNRMKK